MARRNHELTGPCSAGDVLAVHLQDRATDFLRSLRLHREAGPGGGDASADAAARLRRSARRISGTLHTFRPMLDREWSDALRPELAWLSGTLAREHAYGDRLERLLAALTRLSGTPVPVPVRGGVQVRGGVPAPVRDGVQVPVGGGVQVPAPPAPQAPVPVPAAAAAAAAAPVPVPGRGQGQGQGQGSGGRAGSVEPAGALALGAAKAGALLERQLNLARTRAHSGALQALGSARFHAVADSVALLASEVPLAGAAAGPPSALGPLAAEAGARLLDAVGALPLLRAGHPYNAEALAHGLTADPAPQPQDAPWHQVRLLLRLHRYADEVLRSVPDAVPDGAGEGARLLSAGHALDRHRDASEAAAAASAAARTPRITPATAYALGVLHADQRHEVEAARYAFQRLWVREEVRV
ncbi:MULTISPECIES: CHAD domain-containing protein [unclassified Streptomyces]|uniref:CHAD domain-containing protein n=1 Tax=unclassified Streptomyces TaxID=2593676 RepID=UPI0008239BA2|nr:CHAD domain-containing protein [Streptomyces sp. AmelKG-E11A]SCK50858.1 CHAD domain-containing protein [Streptomyces sp. AmelKG-E11A]